MNIIFRMAKFHYSMHLQFKVGFCSGKIQLKEINLQNIAKRATKSRKFIRFTLIACGGYEKSLRKFGASDDIVSKT